MSDFINSLCSWWPVLAFITGTLLGPWLYHLWFGNRRKRAEEQLAVSQKEQLLLQNQLAEQEQLSIDFSNLYQEQNKLRTEFNNVLNDLTLSDKKVKALEREKTLNLVKPTEDFNLKNITLRKKIKKLKKSQKKKGKKKINSASEYELFLEKLEKLVQSSKTAIAKKTRKKTGKTSVKIKKKQKSKAKKSKGNFALYKEKYSKPLSKKKATEDFLQSALSHRKERNITELYGITPEIAKILNNENIFSFSDLSNTKIIRLKEILSAAGGKFKEINPLNWPIQARIAEKGQWEVLEEYKSKMSNK